MLNMVGDVFYLASNVELTFKETGEIKGQGTYITQPGSSDDFKEIRFVGYVNLKHLKDFE